MYKTGWDYLNEIDALAEETRRKQGWRRYFDVEQLQEIERARRVVGSETAEVPPLLVIIARLADLLDEKEHDWPATN
jgi:hypothetical protein